MGDFGFQFSIFIYWHGKRSKSTICSCQESTHHCWIIQLLKDKCQTRSQTYTWSSKIGLDWSFFLFSPVISWRTEGLQYFCSHMTVSFKGTSHMMKNVDYYSRTRIILPRGKPIWHMKFGPHQANKCLRTCAKYAYSDHPAHTQSVIQNFALHSYYSVVSSDSISRCMIWSGPSLSAYTQRHRFAWPDPFNVAKCHSMTEKRHTSSK